ncbi:MAG: patatin family protein [Propionibacteriaceae bacterium]|jgi:predicted patatin/cPLA2 family phospholipase|nr:patatin family protein [Propionibacteriaceae bacterium]
MDERGELASNVTDVALIFEGGGMRVAHSAGVVSTLLEAGIHFDFVAGISAGSSCTVNYLSRDSRRAKLSFVEFAADPNFGSVWTFLQGKGWFNAHYIYEETGGPGQALPFDFGTFAANPAQCRIGSFECDTGQSVYWTKDDLATLPALMRRVRASSTMPILMPPVEIDGRTYVDGALGPCGGFAIDAARAAGFTRFFVVMSREREYRKEPNKWPWLFRAWFRKFPAVAEAVNERWKNYNRTREELFDLQSSGEACLFIPERMMVSNSTVEVAKLQASYDDGLAQAQRELPRWREFLEMV